MEYYIFRNIRVFCFGKNGKIARKRDQHCGCRGKGERATKAVPEGGGQYGHMASAG